MSRDSRIKWTIIGLTVCAAAALIQVQGLHFPPADAISPLAIAGLLGVAAWYYHRRGEESFCRRLALAFEELNNVGTLAPA